jgi:hypothetical protein
MLPREPAAARVRTVSTGVTEARHGILQYSQDEPEVATSLAWYGEYLQAELDLIVPHVRLGMTVLLANGGVGSHALALARLVGPDGRLFVHEPRPRLRVLLNQNFAANDVRQATIVSRALGGHEPIMDAHARPISDTVDDLGLASLDWIKLDACGDALAVLEGAKQTLWQRRPSVLIRVGDPSLIAPIATHLGEYGYRRWRVAAPLFNRDNFKHRSEDVFGGGSVTCLVGVPEERDYATLAPGCVELA